MGTSSGSLIRYAPAILRTRDSCRPRSSHTSCSSTMLFTTNAMRFPCWLIITTGTPSLVFLGGILSGQFQDICEADQRNCFSVQLDGIFVLPPS